jgi:hypothetical protein
MRMYGHCRLIPYDSASSPKGYEPMSGKACPPPARHHEEQMMEKIHIERHDAAYRIEGLTLTEGGCLFHLRQKHIPGRLLPLIRRSLHTKQAVTLCRASDQDDWMILFPLS